MRFLCITPVAGFDPALRQTMASVAAQSILGGGDGHRIHYVVRCNDPDAQEAIRRLSQGLQEPPGLSLEIVCEADAGMYDAIARVLRTHAGADVYGYLGAGDYYAPNALEIVAEVTGALGIDWLTGLMVQYNTRHHLIGARLPFQYRRRLIEQGFYGTVLPFIQQESTFWTKRLNDRLDVDALAACRYAGDYLLWKTFAATDQLHVVKAWLGGFESRPGQLSVRCAAAYREEMRALAEPPTLSGWIIAWLDRMVWDGPEWFNRYLSRRLVYFDDSTGRYRVKDGAGR